MSALEEIQRAIEKLTELRDASSRGPWEIEATDSYFDPRWDYVRIMHTPTAPVANYDRYIVRDGSYAADSGGLNLPDADLVVTLHRTIDAQLAILKLAANVEASEAPFRTVRPEVKLARAINGTT